MNTKSLLIASISTLFIFLTSANSYAEESCPANWPVTAVEVNNNIDLRVESSMIQNEDLVGDTALQFSSEFSHYVQVNGDLLSGFFINPKTKAEVWIDIGKIVESKSLSDRRCHKIDVDGQIDFSESTESVKESCFPLPSWMCGRKTIHFLELSTRHDGELFKLKSLTSVSR